ncbi:hypothetical protein DSO57_1035775 [Entomophthora muscae]|uniref:Uncharacterized protein n=1 Tax=Entomophthora muscae TaxID=34485 RepID=A0ACC2SNS1_9FUNG|nr:hypothetical protein DSO57_1035775 [Entomophthora muscae]
MRGANFKRLRPPAGHNLMQVSYVEQLGYLQGLGRNEGKRSSPVEIESDYMIVWVSEPSSDF